MIQVGPGVELIPEICKVSQAVVFVSVPWSGPERAARELFRLAVARLQKEFPDLAVSFYRLEADEDEASQNWLTSVGYLDYAIAGNGAILWVKTGQVISSASSANNIGVDGIIDRSLSIW